MSHILQSVLETGQDTRIVQIDFSAAFYWVNHKGILYKLCSVGIRGSVLSILKQLDGKVGDCRSKLVNVVSGVPQRSVLGRYCSSCTLHSFFLYSGK